MNSLLNKDSHGFHSILLACSVGSPVVRASDSRPEGLGSMPPNTLRVHTEYVLFKSVDPKVLWAESRVQGTGEYFPPLQSHGKILERPSIVPSGYHVPPPRCRAPLAPPVCRRCWLPRLRKAVVSNGVWLKLVQPSSEVKTQLMLPQQLFLTYSSLS
ncbi:uncharacterized protein TNCV_1996881 [Trichonephila clavipes]|uniref:Uncharacterized protein n=1 Tax=Trichonephila clavipes TaxID=2585209 RepID=A0A8X6RKC1_TRICX|nr:uncharacterized protein TNCV_1996881 [Trichonephila clavipes]